MISDGCWDNGERFNKFMTRLASLPKSRKTLKKLRCVSLKEKTRIYVDGSVDPIRKHKFSYFKEWIHLEHSPLTFADTIRTCFLIGNFDYFWFNGRIYKRNDLYKLPKDYDKSQENVCCMLERVLKHRQNKEWRQFRKDHYWDIKELKEDIKEIRDEMYYFLRAISETDFRRISSQVMGTTKVKDQDRREVVKTIEIIKRIKSFDDKFENVNDIVRKKEEDLENKYNKIHADISSRTPLGLVKHVFSKVYNDEKEL